jgi:hypothetical protein
MPYNYEVINQGSMFVVCPVLYNLIDAEWYDNIDDASENALEWSVDLQGSNVKVYEAIPNDDYTYSFNCLKSICA